MPRASERQTVAAAGSPLTVDNTATRIPLSDLLASPQPEAATLEVQGAQIRWRKDGTDPSSSVGHLANVGTILTLENKSDLTTWRGIRTGSVSATVHYSLHRW